MLLNQNAHKAHHANPLPVSWYVDESVYQLELTHLFNQTANYFGHQLMVRNAGDYYVLPWTQHGRMLVNDQQNIVLMSNICRHRQAVMLEGHGNTTNIVCPLHRWTYDLNGTLKGAPKFNENPCLHLRSEKLQAWQGLLFDSQRNVVKDLAELDCIDTFNFDGYQFESMKIEQYDFNWKTFMEAYLEDYHVGPSHPGLNQFVDCEHLHWDFGAHFSAQTVGFKERPIQHNSAAYQAWHAAAKKYSDPTPLNGAIWFAYYPFIMLEWYPNVLVVSHLIPQGVNQCSNVTEFYYPEEIALFEPEFIKTQQAAYFETAIEDKALCQRMHQGRRALNAEGIDERGPYQAPMEAGLAHFHAWYRQHMEPHLV